MKTSIKKLLNFLKKKDHLQNKDLDELDELEDEEDERVLAEYRFLFFCLKENRVSLKYGI